MGGERSRSTHRLSGEDMHSRFVRFRGIWCAVGDTLFEGEGCPHARSVLQRRLVASDRPLRGPGSSFWGVRLGSSPWYLDSHRRRTIRGFVSSGWIDQGWEAEVDEKRANDI